MYINKSMSIAEILTKYPETIVVFENHGFQRLDDAKVLEMLKKVSLEQALNMKKVSVDSFTNMIEEVIRGKRESADITMEYVEKKDDAVSLTGLLPCPVRIPLLESFKSFIINNEDININYELKAASAGLDWLKKDVIHADNIDNLSDMFISAGFDLFFDKNLMGKFKSEGVFKDITGLEKYHVDFENENISLKDPEGDYAMIGVVPAIFLVNVRALKGRTKPLSWEDILKPEFANSIALPIADFDLFNSILIHIYKLYGEEGIVSLGRNLLTNMHPAQMVGSSEPVVTIMPLFFSKMIPRDGSKEVVWPKEGAIISPIFMLTKKDKAEELEKVAKFMSSEAVGNILAQQGLFPSVHPNVQNPTKDKPFVWVGWDFIYSNDIGNLIKECESLFNKGVQGL